MLEIRALVDADIEGVVVLWERCGLVRPWNDPRADIARSRATPGSEVFVGLWRPGAGAGALAASVMAGDDGHRGWLYYLAVSPEHRGRGLGRLMVRHAERWLAGLGVPKVELMIRDDNESVREFYRRIGYEEEPRVVMARWLDTDGC